MITVVVWSYYASRPSCSSFHNPDAAYRAAYICRAFLTTIAYAAETRPKLPIPLELPPAQPRLTVLPNGHLKRGPDFYRDFVLATPEDFDGSLIRICRACGRLYLAKRSNQAGCSAICSNRARQTKFREGHVGYHKRYYREARALEARRQAFTVTVEPLEMVEPELDEVA